VYGSFTSHKALDVLKELAWAGNCREGATATKLNLDGLHGRKIRWRETTFDEVLSMIVSGPGPQCRTDKCPKDDVQIAVGSRLSCTNLDNIHVCHGHLKGGG
jgi:hypothetical protein